MINNENLEHPCYDLDMLRMKDYLSRYKLDIDEWKPNIKWSHLVNWPSYLRRPIYWSPTMV